MAWRTAPITAITLVPPARRSFIQGPGLPRPEAYTGTRSCTTTSICASKNALVNSAGSSGSTRRPSRSPLAGAMPSRSMKASANACISGSSAWGVGPSVPSYLARRTDAGSSVSTPKGLSVSSRVSRIQRRSSLGPHPAAPSTPSPPALDTAAAKAGQLAPPMPASTMGCSISRISQTRLASFRSADAPERPTSFNAAMTQMPPRVP